MTAVPTLGEVPLNERGCFAPLLNLLDVQCQLPVEIIPHHFLRRPSPDQIERIQHALNQFNHIFPFRLIFESLWSRDGEKSSATRSEDPQNWRYWIIEASAGHTGAINGGIHSFVEASRLSTLELDCSIVFLPQGGTMSGAYTVPRNYRFGQPPLILDDAAVTDIRLCHKLIGNLGDGYPEVASAVGTFCGLVRIPKSEPLYILGLFATLESLLTHDPTGGYDSLGHQIKTKIQLLNRRFHWPLVYKQFGGCDPMKLWSKLYEVRSLIAHGRQPDFSRQHQVLINREVVTDFLEAAVRAVLRQALSEPDLILDLRAV
jgi:hypothetical protein